MIYNLVYIVVHVLTTTTYSGIIQSSLLDDEIVTAWMWGTSDTHISHSFSPYIQVLLYHRA